MQSLWQDVRFSLKLLLKDKPFSLTALLTLALCIGANTAIFTVVNSVVLNPLPFPDPGRLVILYNRYPAVGVNKGSNGVPDYLDRKQETAVFEELSLIGFSGYDIGADGTPERVPGLYVTPSFFRMWRVSPAIGRAFTEDEAKLGNEKVVVLSHGLWKQRFGGNPGILGQDVRLSGVPYRVIGVMPDGFEAVSRDARLWVPFAFTPEQTSDDARHSNNWSMVGRLRPGVTIAFAQQKINAINQRNLERFPKYRKLIEDVKFNTFVGSFQEELISDVKPTLLLLQAAVVFVLLIGCVNVANLMLVRSNIRMKELAIRFSLGAGRGRLARQLLTESLMLSLAGGALGTLTGYWGVRLLEQLGASDMPRGNTIAMDSHVLWFTLAIAVLTGLLFGMVPVVHLFRRDLNGVFRQTERSGTAEKRALAIRNALVLCQVSLAFVLLIGAALLTLSFSRVLGIDPGFRPESTMTARVSLPRSRYAGEDKARAFFDRALEEIRSIPGIKTASLTTYLPFSGNNNSSVIMIEGYVRGPGENPPVPGFNTIDAQYFRSMGIPIKRGRAFQESDGKDAQRVTIIDEFLAKKYWPSSDPIGAKIRRGIDADSPVLTIVGVVGSVKTANLADQNPVGQIYFHSRQSPPGSGHLVIKTSGEGEGVMNAVRARVARLDPELPLSDIRSMPQRIEHSLANRRATMTLCLVFAGVALLLSATGIYGVLAYAVTQRTREFGIRMALGANGPDVLRMVFWHGLRLAIGGLALGAGAALFLTRFLAAMLFGVKPTDPAVFAGVALVLTAVAVSAALLPSVRATRIDPLVALRYE